MRGGPEHEHPEDNAQKQPDHEPPHPPHPKKKGGVFLRVRTHSRHGGTLRKKVELIPNEKVTLMIEVTQGHTILNTITYLDTAGNPMLTPVTPDSPPAWTQQNAHVDALTISANGDECDALTEMPGQDVITVALTVGGVAYTASVNVQVDAPPQVLGSIEINSVVQ